MTFTDERVFMNTIVRIQVVSSKGTVFTRTRLQKAFDCFDHVVNNFSRFLKSSELNKLNKESGKAFVCSPELYSLIDQALSVAAVTEGYYDPTVIDLLEAYGYDKKQDFRKLQDPKLFEEIARLAKDRPSYSAIECDPKQLTVKLAKQQRIELGSIGKGYAIDLAYAVLEHSGFEGFLINAGGDLRSFGNNSQNLPWKVALYRSPLPNHQIEQNQTLGTVELYNKSVCGSGGWARKVGIFHHLLNPKTGIPVNDYAQSFVIADTATAADLWASALFVTGPKLLSEIEKREMAGLLIDFNGNIFKSPRFQYDVLV